MTTHGPRIGGRVRYADYRVVSGGMSARRRGTVEGADVSRDEALVRWDHEPQRIASLPYVWLTEAPGE